MSHRLFWAHRPFYFRWVFDQLIKVRKAITKLWYFQPGPNAFVIFIQLSRLCRNRISVLHFITNRNGSKYWLSMIFSSKVKRGRSKRKTWTYGYFNQIIFLSPLKAMLLHWVQHLSSGHVFLVRYSSRKSFIWLICSWFQWQSVVLF